MEQLLLEKENLKKTLNIIEELLLDEKKDLAKLYEEYNGNTDVFNNLERSKKIHINNLETSLDKPYFARIDFISDDDGKLYKIYIGKNGVSKKGDIIVTDWRAPISSLYYDGELGNSKYEAPEGIITGQMKLKRQFEISKGKLQEYFDVDLVNSDMLLQKYLNSNNDSRLKSIVSTIQKEQNEVIRKRLDNNLIIQGVAGSGKTTVALHRIAYLVYNYLKNIRQNQYLVIGPNPVFIKYIKSVLPDLDVSGVEQCTFEEFAKQYINEDIKINSSEQKASESISGKITNDIDKFKCSIKYKNMLDSFMSIYFCSLTNQDLKLGDFVILDKSVIKEVFEATKNNYNTDLSNRVENTILRLCKIIDDRKENILSKYNDYAFNYFKNINPNEDISKIKLKFSKDREEIKKGCKSTVRKYFSKSKVTPTKMYKLFLNSILDYDLYNYSNLNILKKDTLKNIKNNCYDFEDLASLIYLKNILSPAKEYNSFRHVVVDEAQDLGEFNFAVLKSTLPNATFSIFGDLAQSIYDYRGIDNWEDVNEAMFNNNGSLINFNKSYRTTSEIMSVADEISDSLGLGKSELVVRHGEKVQFTEIEKRENIALYIKNKIEEYKNRGYNTIAVVSKTDLISSALNEELLKIGISIPNVSLTDDLSDDKFKVCTISNQLAKGLEFDAVIINNANEEVYSSGNKLDMKLLYVAITRALHELDIIYTGKLTKPLENIIDVKEEQKVKRIKY